MIKENKINFKTFLGEEYFSSPAYTPKSRHAEESYKGISRQEHPKWEGWKIIRKYKNDNVCVEDIQDLKLEKLVENFYHLKYIDSLFFS